MSKSYLERKEEWARKMIEKGQAQPPERSQEKLPPGQHWAKDFPVLDLGIHPKVALEAWRLELSGYVEHPEALTWNALQSMPQVELMADFHCVTTWSVKDCLWTGVSCQALLDRVQPKAEVQQVLCTGYDGYTTNLAIEHLLDEQALLATHWNGRPLTLPHGAPARLILPKLYAWKGAKFIRCMEFLAEPELGYWEKRGYSESADPWMNDRFAHVAKRW